MDINLHYLGFAENIIRSILFVLLAIVFFIVWNYRKDTFKKIYKKSKKRLYLGLPLGSIILISLNLLVYLYIQKGFWNPNNPLWLPFVSNSVYNPVGMVLSSFSHADLSHLASNMLAAAIFLPIAEIIFKTSNRAKESIFPSYIRAFLIFPLIWIFAGFVVSFGAPSGLGFSGVVFAIMGFCVALFPIFTIGVFLFRIFLTSLISAFLSPIEITTATATLTQPEWAGVGIWAHFLGFLIGILIAFMLFNKLKNIRRPDPLHVFSAVLIVGLITGLDWIFSYSLSESYILLGGVGFAFLIIISILSFGAWYSLDDEEASTNKLQRSESKSSFFENKERNVSFLTLVLIFLLMLAMFGGTKVISEDPNMEGPTYNTSGYTVWFSEENIMVYNSDRDLYASLTSLSQLSLDGHQSLKIGNMTYYGDLNIFYHDISAPDGDTAYAILVNSSEGNKWIHESESISTGQFLSNFEILVGFSENNSLYEIKGVQKDNGDENNKDGIEFGAEIPVDKEVKVQVEGTDIRFIYEEGSIKYEGYETEGILATTDFPLDGYK